MANCPSCGSSNTKTMQMVWASGLRNSTRSTTGGGITSRGTIGVGASSSRGVSQSALSASCAPPKPSALPKVVVGILGFFFWLPMFTGAMQSLGNGKIIEGILLLPLLALVTYGLYRLYRYLDRRNQLAAQDYVSRWICLRCGTTFQP